MYQAEYFETGYPDSSVTAPLAGVSTTKYWNVLKVSGADGSVQLLLHDPLPGANATDGIVTANYNGRWTAANGTVLSPGNVTTGTVTSKPFSTAGLYTFGYGDSAALNSVSGTIFNGLHYKYYEGGYWVVPDFNTLTPVKTGNSLDFDLNIRPSGVKDSFAIVWEGYINIPAAGSYTFSTVSDDGSKFYFNSLYNPISVALVDNDSTHPARIVSGMINIPAAGRYPITVTYFENGGQEQLQVYWEGPGIPKQLIPALAFTDAVIQPFSGGLKYKYYEGAFNTLADLAGKTPVKTGVSPNVDISVRPPAVNDNFALIWEGKLSIPATGTYTFETISDDGSQLVVNGVPVVTNDGLHAHTSVNGSITLATGVYPISISYFEKDGGETMQVYWSGPGITRQIIPDSAFMPELTLATALNKNVSKVSGTADQSGKSTITQVYPNPFDDQFKISFYNNKANDDISIAIYDLNGKQLYSQHKGRLAQGNTTMTVNLKDKQLKEGIYLVAVNVNGLKSKTVKVIKHK
jgi:hypothetical protein